MLDIARACERNNPPEGITGALYFDGRQFLQLIEGDMPALDGLLATLRRDTRHTQLHVIDRLTNWERVFPGYPMKFVDGSNNRKMQAMFDYTALVAERAPGLPRRIAALATH